MPLPTATPSVERVRRAAADAGWALSESPSTAKVTDPDSGYVHGYSNRRTSTHKMVIDTTVLTLVGGFDHSGSHNGKETLVLVFRADNGGFLADAPESRATIKGSVGYPPRLGKVLEYITQRTPEYVARVRAENNAAEQARRDAEVAHHAAAHVEAGTVLLQAQNTAYKALLAAGLDAQAATAVLILAQEKDNALQALINARHAERMALARSDSARSHAAQLKENV